MSNKYLQLGTFFKRTEKGTNKPLLDKKGRQQYSLQLTKDIKSLVINGVEYNKNYFYVNRPDEKLDIMLNNGKITEEEYDQKVSRFEEGGDLSNVVFEIKSAE